MAAHKVDVMIEYTSAEGACPECGACCPRHDVRPSRTWRHLDTMQFGEAFSALKHSDLKVARAWAIKELFRDFWSYATRGWGAGISTVGIAGRSVVG